MRKRILMILHLPPPVHGASAVGEMIRTSARLAERFEMRFINLSTSSGGDEIGKWSVRKLFRLVHIRREVRRALKEFRPDKVYCTPSAAFPGLLKDSVVLSPVRRRHIPLVAHFHNRGIPSRSGWKDFFYRRLFSGTQVILLSERLLPEFSRFACSVRFCPNGIDALPAAALSDREVPILLFLSNLIVSKGVLVLLDACRILKEAGASFRCVFAGSASYDLSVEAFAEEVTRRGLQDVVEYVGPRYGVEKERLFAESDVFVFPTRYPNESFPLVILEAMSCGLPVVSTDAGAIEDMVLDGVTGFVCHDSRPEGLADCLARLLDDQDLRRRMGSEGRRHYSLHFTRDAFENRLSAILDE